MTSQQFLMEDSGSSLPGPQFTPRPGWGGRLRRWFAHNGVLALLRMFFVVSLVLVLNAVLHKQPAYTPTPTQSPQALSGFTIQAKHGDGMEKMAERALNLYVALQSRIIRLDGAQHLFASNTLAAATYHGAISEGQSVTFKNADIEAAITAALGLSPIQHSAWERLVK